MSEIIKIPLTMSEQWLTDNKFDGLYCDNHCACKKDDLFPCGEYSIQCLPGVIKNCQLCESLKNNVCSEDYEFCIHAKQNIDFDDSDAMKYILDQEKKEFEQELKSKSEIDYKYCELYYISSIKFKLYYFHKTEYKQLVKAVDNFMQNRKSGQNSEVVFLPGKEEIRITFTSQNCCSVYFKRKQDLE